MNEFNQVKEVFMSLVKWFLIFVIINNLIWVGVLYMNGSDQVSVEYVQNQDGQQNNQEMKHGTKSNSNDLRSSQR